MRPYIPGLIMIAIVAIFIVVSSTRFTIPIGGKKVAVEDYESVYVEYGETVNTGNYENIKFTIGVTRRLQKGESPKEVIDSMASQVKQQWQLKINQMMKQR